MLIRFQERDYDLDLSDFTLRQAETIEAETGLSLGKWLDQLSGDGFDFDSKHALKFMRVLYWLMINQAGDDTPISAVDFPLLKFGQAFMAAAAAEMNGSPAQDVELPDPTRPPLASVPSAAPSSPKRKNGTARKGSPHG